MPDVFIIIDGAESTSQFSSLSIAQAMKQAIWPNADPGEAKPDLAETFRVEILEASHLAGRKAELRTRSLCPMTLNLPGWLVFPGQATFAACADMQLLRDRVADWQYSTNAGHYWLPLVLTAKGVLFGEVIAQANGAVPTYYQPFHLADAQRQPLYELGQRLLRSLAAPPGVYLLQFGLLENRIEFDRLLPFPGLPAIASISVQTPNLFQCHWACLTNQPIRDLYIGSEH